MRPVGDRHDPCIQPVLCLHLLSIQEEMEDIKMRPEIGFIKINSP